MTNFEWEDFKHPEITKLREEYGLLQIVSSDSDEFTKQLLLKSWVYKTLPHGNPSRDYSQLSSFEILSDALEGKELYCSQYAFVTLQCGIALGWYTRKLGVDTDHAKGEKEQHHGVIDIWSNQFEKWYAIDAMFDLHYEKNGIPLNSLEIRSEYLKNKAQDIIGIIGNHKDEVSFDETSTGNNTPSNYFWFFVSLRNNFFARPGMYDTNTLLWEDDHNSGKVWYKGGGGKGKPYKHPMYESQFIITSDEKICFPQITHFTSPKENKDSK